MTELTRPRYAKKIEKIGNERIRLLSGFVPTESEITDRMMGMVEDFPQIAADEGYEVLSLGGGLHKDYDQKLYWEGIYIKKYRYDYLVPYLSPKNGEERHFQCYMHFSKEWYKDDRGTPEMGGFLFCDISRDGDEELKRYLESNELVVVKSDNKWAVKNKWAIKTTSL